MQPRASDRPACSRPLSRTATEQDTRSGFVRFVTVRLVRAHGQDSSGSAPMGSSGVIISHQGSSGVIAHLRTQRQKGGITPCRKSLRQSA